MRWVVGAALAVVVGEVALIGWLLVPDAAQPPMLLCVAMMLSPLPLVGLAAIVEPLVPLRRPRVVVVIGGLGLVTLVLATLVGTVALPQRPAPGPGNPEDLGGGAYVLNQHGSRTPVSEDVYEDALASNERSVLWIGALGCLVAVTVAGGRAELAAAKAAARRAA